MRLALVFAVFAVALAAAPVALAQQVPATPAPVPVTLDGKTTAVLVLDATTQTCGPQAKCTEFLPRVATMLDSARAAGAYVLYSGTGQPTVIDTVAPAAGDPVIIGYGQDRFFDTNLDELLRAKHIQNLVLAGWRENGSVLYTAVGANLRDYTVVVADDGTSAAQDYDVAIGRYQLLTQLNSNPNNEPLHPNAVTLSTTGLITFQ